MLQALLAMLPALLNTGVVLIPEIIKAVEDDRIDGEEWKRLIMSISGMATQPIPTQPVGEFTGMAEIVDSIDKLTEAITKLSIIDGRVNPR